MVAPSTTPLALVGAVNGHPVRFYQSPMGGADWPWHVFADLLEAVGYQDDQRQLILGEWCRVNPAEARSVDADGASLTIVSRRAAEAVFRWLAMNQWLAAEDYYDFWTPAATLFAEQTRHLTADEYAHVQQIAEHRFDGAFGNA